MENQETIKETKEIEDKEIREILLESPIFEHSTEQEISELIKVVKTILKKQEEK